MLQFPNRISSFIIFNRRILLNTQGRYASYLGSSVYNPDEKINFEATKSPREWNFVERLIPAKYIPDPVKKDSYPSGWKPQNPEVMNRPYYVRRSFNHMLPIYLSISHRGTKRVTTVRHIEGDVWLFADDLKTYLEEKTGKSLGFRVDEVGCKISFRGDYVYFTQQFLTNNGL